MSTQELGVVEENGVSSDGTEDGVERLVALGRALSDPLRVRMLGMMADGRSCCEFEEVFGMAQSKVSYHMKNKRLGRMAHGYLLC